MQTEKATINYIPKQNYRSLYRNMFREQKRYKNDDLETKLFESKETGMTNAEYMAQKQ